MKPDAPSANAAAEPRRPATRHRPRRWLPWLIALVLLGLIVAGLWPRPLAVEVAQVTVGPLRVAITEEGKTRLRQRYLLAAPVAGHLRRVTLKAGDAVQAGETVAAVIDPLTPALLDARSRSLAEARRDMAAANLLKAQAALEFAVKKRERFDKLFAEKTISIQELEPVQWREVAAAREKAAAESALRQAEAELAVFTTANPAPNASGPDPVEVRSPASGRVLRVFEESARAVAAGTPLLEVGDPADLEVVIEVLSRDGAALAPGTPMELSHWGGPKPLAARVRLVEPAAFTKVSALGVEEQRVNVIADLLSPAAERPGLGDGFRVEASILIWEEAKTLKVPAGSLFRRGSQWYAFVVANGRAELRAVEAGRSNGRETQVLSGLREGESVVLYPGDRLEAGLRVRAIRI